MERKNQIIKAGLEYQDSLDEFQRCHTYPKWAFIDGAKWADENPKKGLVSIDKVCEWLNSVDMRMYVIADHTSSNINRFDMNKFISDLHKAMEGQIVETKIICNKCGSNNFGLHKSILFCKDCGEMYNGDGKRYHIESADFLTGEIKLGEIKLKK